MRKGNEPWPNRWGFFVSGILNLVELGYPHQSPLVGGAALTGGIFLCLNPQQLQHLLNDLAWILPLL